MGMNVVHAGSTYQIYGDSLQTYKELPVGTYEVCFSKMTGFFLTSHNDLEINEEKIYGSSPEKVEKVLKGFQAVSRNFGVILSGRKGIGKSLFARQLATRAKEYNLPIILVTNYIPGIADFISSIEQEVIVLFDEFEKTFGETDDCRPQEEMLPLFDGIDNGKKLFIITCNEIHKLNSYLINRPGRFHYHFVLGNPNPDEIKEYMTDKLKPEYHHLIKKLIGFSINVDLTYDVLRAIAFELNMGYSFEETLMDLNISKEGNPKYNVRVDFADGTYRIATNLRINIYSGDREYCWLSEKSGRSSDSIRLSFIPSDVVLDMDHAEMTLDPNKVERYVDEDYFDMDKPEDKKRYEYLSDIEITKITFSRVVEDYTYKYLV
jgi:hypothetical protein